MSHVPGDVGGDVQTEVVFTYAVKVNKDYVMLIFVREGRGKDGTRDEREQNLLEVTGGE